MIRYDSTEIELDLALAKLWRWFLSLTRKDGES